MFNSNPGENDTNSVVRGEEAFSKSCVSCHGKNADGRGEEAGYLTTSPTNFRNPDYSKKPARIAAHIAYGKGSDMPAFDGKLPYETIWDMANYLHSLQKN